MRFIVPFALALLVALPAQAADCRPLAERFLMLQETNTNLIELVQARPVDWQDLKVPAGREAAYKKLKQATDAMLPLLQGFIETGKPAVPVVADCRAAPMALPAGQLVLLQRAVMVADQLVPLLVRYLVAFDAATVAEVAAEAEAGK